MFLYSAASCKKTTYGSWYCYSCVVKTFHGIFLPHACQDYALPALTLEGLEFDPRSSHTKDWKNASLLATCRWFGVYFVRKWIKGTQQECPYLASACSLRCVLKVIFNSLTFQLPTREKNLQLIIYS